MAKPTKPKKPKKRKEPKESVYRLPDYRTPDHRTKRLLKRLRTVFSEKRFKSDSDTERMFKDTQALLDLEFEVFEALLGGTTIDSSLVDLLKLISTIFRDRIAWLGSILSRRRALFRDLEFYNRQTRRHPYINAGLYKTEADLTPDESTSLDKLLFEKAMIARFLLSIDQLFIGQTRLEQINKEIHRLLEIQPPGGRSMGNI